jgi:prevent-host-death family protein
VDTVFRQIEDLPNRPATEVKNRWGEVVREARASGGVAVTSHGKVELVVLDAGRYRELAALVEGAKERDKAALAELEADFDRRLAVLSAPDVRQRIDRVFAARGRVFPRPKAGTSY